MSQHRDRAVSLDVIRSVALLSVMAFHFFTNNTFPSQTVDSFFMLPVFLLRQLFLVCVPLFLLLSGYLLHSRKPTLSYYLRIIRVLFLYLAASLVFFLYQRLVLPERPGLAELVIGTLDYSYLWYGWYIEMYLGLFLLIPFLNILYQNLENKKQKQLLLLSLLFLTAAPSFFNSFRFSPLQWWLRPSSIDVYHPLIPEWWSHMYPITYYFLGSYLREYGLNCKRSTAGLLLVAVILFSGCFQFYRSFGSIWVDGPWLTFGSLLLTVQSVLVFHLLSSFRYQRLGPRLKAGFAFISDHSLGAYLISCLADHFVYSRLAEAVPVVLQRLPWIFVTVPIVFGISLLLSALLQLLYRATAEKWLARLQA